MHRLFNQNLLIDVALRFPQTLTEKSVVVHESNKNTLRWIIKMKEGQNQLLMGFLLEMDRLICCCYARYCFHLPISLHLKTTTGDQRFASV